MYAVCRRDDGAGQPTRREHVERKLDELRRAMEERGLKISRNNTEYLGTTKNEDILEETKVEAIATVMRRRRLEWFGHVKRRGEAENIRAVAEMKMEGKRPRGRPQLRWKDTVRRDLKA